MEEKLTPASLAKLEYERLSAMERDRINARLTTLQLFGLLASASGYGALADNQFSYLLALLPFFLACLALHIRQSEDALHKERKQLYRIEQSAGYAGHEHASRDASNARQSHGWYFFGFRGAFCIADLLAISVVAVHLWSDHLYLVALPFVAMELVLAGFTFWLLRR